MSTATVLLHSWSNDMTARRCDGGMIKLGGVKDLKSAWSITCSTKAKIQIFSLPSPFSAQMLSIAPHTIPNSQRLPGRVAEPKLGSKTDDW